MKLTLLIDLDDTLFDNDMGDFVPAYLHALSQHMQSISPPEQFIRFLLQAMTHMQSGQNPLHSLKENFDAVFYPSIGVNIHDVQPQIRDFYERFFPKLCATTKKRPQAIELVQKVFKRGYKVVVATNPLFPKTAQLQRLAWAGFPDSEYPFDLVTAYEDFHFAKPNPAYYAEVLGRIGWPDQPAVMIGNDVDNDIIPAQKIGLPTFLVHREDQPVSNQVSTAHGNLADVLPWIDSLQSSLENKSALPRSAIIPILQATLAVFTSLTKGLSAQQWATRPTPKEWSPTEILCHMRDVDVEVNEPRIKQITQESNPILQGINTDPWVKERNYQQQDGTLAFKQFTAARQQILKNLQPLADNEWNRPARHTILGPTNLEELAGIIAAHDRLHIQQLFNCLNG